MKKAYEILIGDCLTHMASMDAASVESIVTDPPYGLGFMGKDWDSPGGVGDFPMRRTQAANTVNTGVTRQGGRQRSTVGFAKRQARDAAKFQEWCRVWATEALRVAKPGAHLLAFGGTRMFHRLACGIEDAGWELRDTIMWVYGSGFPKSRNLEGEWKGWGTALKPAWEPIIVARKSLVGSVEANMAQHRTGAINIDGCRIAGEFGRWPANIVHDGSEDVLGLLPGAAGAAGAVTVRNGDKFRNTYGAFQGQPVEDAPFYADSGSAARFFYCAKADRSDRNIGLEGVEAVPFGMSGAAAAAAARGEHYDNGDSGMNRTTRRKNHHPTVKPTDLMRWLCRLVTPPGGSVLDPFMGSGSTGRGARLEGFGFIGIELDEGYAAIARKRISDVAPLFSGGPL